MDNDGFHHGHRVELVLRAMLEDCGIRVLFQPPYSLHFNTCEYYFNQIKAFLLLHQALAFNETKIAIAEAVLNIYAENSYAYFKHCGYFEVRVCSKAVPKFEPGNSHKMYLNTTKVHIYSFQEHQQMNLKSQNYA